MRFVSTMGAVTINGRTAEVFQYRFCILGWLASVLWWLGWIGLIGLIAGWTGYCLKTRWAPWDALEEWIRSYGLWRVALAIGGALGLWIVGLIARAVWSC